MSNWTPADILAIAAAFAALIAAIGAVVVNVIVALKTADAHKETTTQIAEVSQKATLIEGHVNSAAAAAAGKIAGLENTNLELQRTVADMRSTAQLLAQAAARATPPPPPAA